MILDVLGRFFGDKKRETGRSRKVCFQEKVKNADQEAMSDSGPSKM